MSQGFLQRGGGYRRLVAFKMSEIVCDLSVEFVQRHVRRTSRTVDQMEQAARSGKQNIAEGSKASMTSRKTEIVLTNVAKSSLEELLLDYEDYLRQHRLPIWDKDHPRTLRLRQYLRSQEFMNDPLALVDRLQSEEFCNMCITLIHQTQFMLDRLLDAQQKQFEEQGGIREQMTRARLQYRNQTNQTNRTYQTNPTDWTDKSDRSDSSDKSDRKL